MVDCSGRDDDEADGFGQIHFGGLDLGRMSSYYNGDHTLLRLNV